MNERLLSILREWFGAKNNKNLALMITLDIIFFSLFGYVAYQSRDPSAWCVAGGGVPVDFYNDYVKGTNTTKELNWTIINDVHLNST
jgi:hypothetical protein